MEGIEDGDAILDSALDSTVFDFENWWLINTTRRGDVIVSEAYTPASGDPLRSRPSVYLDQNHWSTLAQAVTAPDRIRTPEILAAARRLSELASDEGIVLPLSSATLHETYGLFGDRRYEVGLTIGRLSAGWQLRHVLAVQAYEFRALFAREFGLEIETAPPAITLEPMAWRDQGVRTHLPSDDGTELLKLIVTGATAMIDSLLTDERLEPVDLDWARKNESLARRITELPANRRGEAAFGFATLDHERAIRSSLASLGKGLTDLQDTSQKAWHSRFARMPATGLAVEIMTRRLQEPGRRWRDNDLIDIWYLCTASAYADYVVAERSTGQQLRQIIRGRGSVPNVFTSIPGLVEQLEQAGVSTAAERFRDGT